MLYNTKSNLLLFLGLNFEEKNEDRKKSKYLKLPSNFTMQHGNYYDSRNHYVS